MLAFELLTAPFTLHIWVFNLSKTYSNNNDNNDSDNQTLVEVCFVIFPQSDFILECFSRGLTLTKAVRRARQGMEMAIHGDSVLQ